MYIFAKIKLNFLSYSVDYEYKLFWYVQYKFVISISVWKYTTGYSILQLDASDNEI